MTADTLPLATIGFIAAGLSAFVVWAGVLRLWNLIAKRGPTDGNR